MITTTLSANKPLTYVVTNPNKGKYSIHKPTCICASFKPVLHFQETDYPTVISHLDEKYPGALVSNKCTCLDQRWAHEDPKEIGFYWYIDQHRKNVIYYDGTSALQFTFIGNDSPFSLHELHGLIWMEKIKEPE